MLKERYDRGQLNELTREVQRLQFVHWLVERGRLHEGTREEWANEAWRPVRW